MAEVVVAARRRVAAHDVLAANTCRDGDVLAGGQAERVLRVGQRETVATEERERSERAARAGAGKSSHRDVGGDHDLLREGELLPYLRVQHRLALCTMQRT